MRSDILKSILDETPEDVGVRVRELGEAIIKEYKRKAEMQLGNEMSGLLEFQAWYKEANAATRKDVLKKIETILNSRVECPLQ